MKYAFLPLLPLSLLWIAAVGCSNPEEDSCNIKTPGMFVEYEVVNSGGTTVDATAKFWVGNKAGGTSLFLGSCDAITINGAKMVVKGSGQNVYRATINLSDNYDFVLAREDEDPYSSTVTTPELPVLTAPVPTDSFLRDEGFDITWVAGSGNINLLVKGSCTKSFPSVGGENVPDNGTYSVAAGKIQSFTSSETKETCTANVTLTRTNAGTLSSQLKGKIHGKSKGATSFKSLPAQEEETLGPDENDPGNTEE